MRLAILADIHANLPALEAVLDDVSRQSVDGIVVAGDLLVGGPQPAEVLRLLRSLGAWLIQGNAEDYLTSYDSCAAPAAWRTVRQWAAVRWSHRRLGREELDLAASLPVERTIALPGAAPLRVVHGAPQHPHAHLLPDHNPEVVRLFQRASLPLTSRHMVPLRGVLAGIAEHVLVCGHSHIAWREELDGRLALNPGSVGCPIDGTVGAEYALLTWRGDRWQAELQVVPYDLAGARAAFVETGFLAEVGGFARACLQDIESGRNAPGRLVAYAYRLAAQAGFADCEVVPDAIWDQAVATFDWDVPASN